MAITSSAKKAIRNSERKRVFNLRRQRIFKDLVKEIRDLVKNGDCAKAKEMLPKAFKAIDKAAKGNTIEKNTASRLKSRLAKAVSKGEKK